MSYEITANRKRPQNFDLLAGQEFVVSTLKNAINSKKIAHAYLFSGPRGVGKTSSARILAKALNCINGPTSDPCGVCSSCVEIQKGHSMDVLEIDGASNTSVNDIREIKDEVLFAPANSRYKIYIIDEVHMLSNSAFNALLKTIEEPPPYIIFIFATTEIHKVPATIRSRCQQFNFRMIDYDTIRDLLRVICIEQEVIAEDEALFWIAKESTGSLRDAYTLFDQVSAFSGNEITLAKIKEKLGFAGLDRMNELAEYIVLGDKKNAIELCGSVLQSGVSIEQFIYDLGEYFRNLLLLKVGIQREAILGFSAERFHKGIIETLSSNQLESGLEVILKLYRDVRYSLNPRFELDATVARLCSLKDFISSADILKRIQEIREEFGGERPVKKKIELGSVSSTNKIQNDTSKMIVDEKIFETPVLAFQPEVNNKPLFEKAAQNIIKKDILPLNTIEPVLSLQQEERTSPKTNDPTSEDIKNYLLQHLKSKDPFIYSHLTQALDWTIHQNTITISVEKPFHAGTLKKSAQTLTALIKNEFGKHYQFNVVSGNSGAEEIEAEKQLDQTVDKVLKIFRGNVIGEN